MSDSTLDRQGLYVQSVIERIRYKRGWTLTVLPCPTTPGWLWLQAESIEPDSRSEGVSRNQVRTYLIATYQTIPKVLASVRQAIQTWELHEVDEWFIFDGERVHDPHACDECFVGNNNHHHPDVKRTRGEQVTEQKETNDGVG